MKIEIRGVERLSFRERQVAALKEMGASSRQVAKRLHLTEGTVGTLLNRAKKKGYEVVIILEGDPLALFGAEDDNEEEEDIDLESDN